MIINRTEIKLNDEDVKAMKRTSQILQDIRDGMANAKMGRVICKNEDGGNMAFYQNEVQEMSWGVGYLSEAFTMDNTDGLGNTLDE